MEFSSFPRLAIHGVGCHLVMPGRGDKLSPPPGQPRDQDGDQDGKQPIRLTIPLHTHSVFPLLVQASANYMRYPTLSIIGF